MRTTCAPDTFSRSDSPHRVVSRWVAGTVSRTDPTARHIVSSGPLNGWEPVIYLGGRQDVSLPAECDISCGSSDDTSADPSHSAGVDVSRATVVDTSRAPGGAMMTASSSLVGYCCPRPKAMDSVDFSSDSSSPSTIRSGSRKSVAGHSLRDPPECEIDEPERLSPGEDLPVGTSWRPGRGIFQVTLDA